MALYGHHGHKMNRDVVCNGHSRYSQFQSGSAVHRDIFMNNCEDDFDVDKFVLCWDKSIAAQLLVPNPHNTCLHLGKGSGELASIAYLACARNTIHLLDKLFVQWEISEKGKPDFKGKLKENWHEKGTDECRNIANDTLASIAELSVATYLDSEGYTIENINAWGDKRADITCENNSNKYYFEVKYFPDSPELYNLRINAAKGNSVFCSSISSRSETLNYLYYRLGEAAIQLDKPKKYGKESRIAFFVFAEIASHTGRSIFEKSLGDVNDWYRLDDNSIPGLPADFKKEIIDKYPRHWLTSLKCLFVGTMIDWRIENINTYCTKI